jgi:hypothetical protein
MRKQGARNNPGGWERANKVRETISEARNGGQGARRDDARWEYAFTVFVEAPALAIARSYRGTSRWGMFLYAQARLQSMRDVFG